MPLHKFKCVFCGGPGWSYNQVAAHCSNACRHEHARQLRTQSCVQCGQVFTSSVQGRTFCDRRCARRARADDTRGVKPEPATIVGCRWIPLTRGAFTLVDEVDYARIMGVNTYWICDTDGYAATKVGRRKVFLHWLLGGVGWDHRSGDPLDNRRCNLRPATLAQNAQNRKRSVRNKSGFVGVRRVAGKVSKPWTAQIVAGRQIHLGYFATAKDAARARDVAAIKLHGEYARLNFPIEVKSPAKQLPRLPETHAAILFNKPYHSMPAMVA